MIRPWRPPRAAPHPRTALLYPPPRRPQVKGKANATALGTRPALPLTRLHRPPAPAAPQVKGKVNAITLLRPSAGAAHPRTPLLCPPPHRPQVKGKVNAITLDSCTRTGLLFDTGAPRSPAQRQCSLEGSGSLLAGGQQQGYLEGSRRARDQQQG